MRRKDEQLGLGLHKFRIKVQHALTSFGLNIFIAKEINGKLYTAKPVQWEFVELKEGCKTEPTLRLEETEAGDLTDALVEELGRRGIKTQSDSKIEGLLEAQTKHLTNLQKLLFKETNHEV